MIIRHSIPHDIDGIVSLWNEAFGDSEKEIRFFIDNRADFQNTLLCEIDGEIASVLFLLDGKLNINGTSYPSYYLYAACTLKKFRGRGLMSVLLKEAENVALSRNKKFICLMPGEKSLFEFYEKHGYMTVFTKKICTVNVKDIDYSSSCEEIIDIEFAELRNKAFSEFDYFEWDNSSIEFAVAHTKMYSGNVIKSRKGYMLYSENENLIYVKEFAFADKNFNYGLNLLFSLCNSEKVIINLPGNYNTQIGESEIVPSAMLVPVDAEAKMIADSVENAYLGLTLD